MASGLGLGAVAALAVFGAQVFETPHGPDIGAPEEADRGFLEVRRFPANEANQGVAVDATHFFAVGNTVIGKYERETGRRVDEWRGGPDSPIIHLNSCVVVDAQLVCAHSNYPALPMMSSIEIWDPETLEHVQSRSLGLSDGSLTWVLRRDGDWWLGFAHYATIGGAPGKGPQWSTVVQFDEGWRQKAAYAYPVALIDRLRPYSASGGNWGPDGRLYVTGHDAREIYVLRVPETGAVLQWTETIPAPMDGQAWVFDPGDPSTVWGIARARREVVMGTRRP